MPTNYFFGKIQDENTPNGDCSEGIVEIEIVKKSFLKKNGVGSVEDKHLPSKIAAQLSALGIGELEEGGHCDFGGTYEEARELLLSIGMEENPKITEYYNGYFSRL